MIPTPPIYLTRSPEIHPSAFIAPGATVVGDVTIGEESSVWYSSVLRGGHQPDRRRPTLKYPRWLRSPPRRRLPLPRRPTGHLWPQSHPPRLHHRRRGTHRHGRHRHGWHRGRCTLDHRRRIARHRWHKNTPRLSRSRLTGQSRPLVVPRRTEKHPPLGRQICQHFPPLHRTRTPAQNGGLRVPVAFPFPPP